MYIIDMRSSLHDYTKPAGYFMTFVTERRQCMLGSVKEGKCITSGAGKLVLATWNEIPKHYPRAVIDAIQVMPDHVHCIIILTGRLDISEEPDNISLPRVIQMFKAGSARRINQLLGSMGTPVWQKGYIDPVIRNDFELEKFRSYICTNPLRWELKRN